VTGVGELDPESERGQEPVLLRFGGAGRVRLPASAAVNTLSMTTWRQARSQSDESSVRLVHVCAGGIARGGGQRMASVATDDAIVR